jgi:hypothetical protein
MTLYRYADLTLASRLQLAELEIASRPQTAPTYWCDILAVAPHEPASRDWIHTWKSEINPFDLALARTNAGFLLRFPGLADFSIRVDSGRIGVWPAPDASDETLRHLLLDQVLPRILAHRDQLVLHAGLVQVAGRAIAFIGATGSGKSTLAANFHAAGHPLLSDDGLVLRSGEGCALALSTYPSLRLWPDAVSGLFKEAPALAPMAHYSTKQRILVDDAAAAINQPLPLAALYVLAPETEAGGVVITHLSARDACMAIIRNAFQLDPTDHVRAAGLLDAASEVARQVPAFTLSYPRAFTSLPAVRAAIVDQAARWTEGAAEGLGEG